MQNYFDYVATNGGIDGRKIVLTGKDDQYQPAATKTNSDEALAANKYAAFDSVLGTPNNLGIWDDTNRECMPQLLNATGAAQWGDVENHPWTTGAQLDYFSEAGLWADWLKQKYPNGVKYTVTDPKKLGDLVPDGPLINNEGKLGTYATVANIG